jgi:hypothetical protein
MASLISVYSELNAGISTRLALSALVGLWVVYYQHFGFVTNQLNAKSRLLLFADVVIINTFKNIQYGSNADWPALAGVKQSKVDHS